MTRDATAYVNLFFKLRPKFLADARAGNVMASNVLDWVYENAPEYEEASKAMGFQSLEDELSFTRKLIDKISDKKEVKALFHILRNGRQPILEDTQRKIISIIGNSFSEDDFTDEEDRAHARDMSCSFRDYGKTCSQ